MKGISLYFSLQNVSLASKEKSIQPSIRLLCHLWEEEEGKIPRPPSLYLLCSNDPEMGD